MTTPVYFQELPCKQYLNVYTAKYIAEGERGGCNNGSDGLMTLCASVAELIATTVLLDSSVTYWTDLRILMLENGS